MLHIQNDLTKTLYRSKTVRRWLRCVYNLSLITVIALYLI